MKSIFLSSLLCFTVSLSGAAFAASTFADADDLCDIATPAGSRTEALEFVQTHSGTDFTRYACIVHPALIPVGQSAPRAVIVLHGGNGNARALMAEAKQITTQASQRGFIAIFAQGLPEASCTGIPCDTNGWSGHMMEGGTLFNRANVNDAYIRLLAAHAMEAEGVPADRIALAGFSGGARTIYRMLSRDLTKGDNAFSPAAVATMAGAIVQVGVPQLKLFDPAALPTKPRKSLGGAGLVGRVDREALVDLAAGRPATPILLLNGKADDRMPEEGGLAKDNTIVRGSFRLKVDMARAMNRAFGDALLGSTTLPSGDKLFVETYAGGKADVVAMEAEGLTHTWPDWFSAYAFGLFDAQTQ